MSTFYFIEVSLDAEINYVNINEILTKGLKEGFSYKNNSNEVQQITLDETINKVLTEVRLNGKSDIYIEFDDTCCFMWFYMTEAELLKISLGGFGAPRKKIFKNGHSEIDFAYYIKLALRLCDDFVVLGLRTKADYDFYE